MTAFGKSGLVGASSLALLAACSKNPEYQREESASAAPSSAATTTRPSAPATAAPGAPGALPEIAAPELLLEARQAGKRAALVNAWASWCGPCRRELPMLQAMAPKLAERGVTIVLVSVDEPEDAGKAQQFLHDNRITLKSYLAARPLTGFKQGLYPRWPGMLPASFLVDAAGAVRFFWGGPAYEDEIAPVIDQFLSGTLDRAEADFPLAPGRVEE